MAKFTSASLVMLKLELGKLNTPLCPSSASVGLGCPPGQEPILGWTSTWGDQLVQAQIKARIFFAALSETEKNRPTSLRAVLSEGHAFHIAFPRIDFLDLHMKENQSIMVTCAVCDARG